MAHFSSLPITLEATLYLLLLAFSVPLANSARILEEEAVPGKASNPIEAQTTPDSDHTLSFFIHDTLGGTNPSARAVTGIVTNAAVNGQLAFARPNGGVLPVNSGTTLTNNNNNGNNPTTNNNPITNNIPFLTGLEGPNNNGLPLINGPEKLLFGTLTVIDDEVTQGHEMGSAVVGKAKGFYVVSSEDGSTQTMAFTTMFESGHYVDSINFFGVHRTGSSESHLAIMGGTGKYVNANGYATIQTVHPVDNNQNGTDGVETLLHFTVYLSM